MAVMMDSIFIFFGELKEPSHFILVELAFRAYFHFKTKTGKCGVRTMGFYHL